MGVIVEGVRVPPTRGPPRRQAKCPDALIIQQDSGESGNHLDPLDFLDNTIYGRTRFKWVQEEVAEVLVDV